MVKFFLLLYTVTSLCAANTEIARSKAESEVFSDVTPSNAEAYAEATSKIGPPTEGRRHHTRRPANVENCKNNTGVTVDNIKGALKCSLPNESPTCVKTCPPARTCRNRKERYHCPLIALNATCSYNCTCNDGFYRNDEGFCVTSDLCESQECSLPNESLKCVKSCPGPRTCANRNRRYQCPNNANKSCKLECVCDYGFFRNADGFCVTSDLCDKKCTGPNEEYKADKKNCPPEVCKSIVSRYACDPEEIGQPGCVCKSGFLRLDLNSSCIPTKECPELANQSQECSLPNESLKCVKSCPGPRTCANRNRRYKCPNNVNISCKIECVCDYGFYRNSDGFCVTSDLCDKKCTGPNEKYIPDKKKCPPEICPPRFGVIRYACNPNEVGQPGCACKPGFRRLNLNSTCIPIEECPAKGNLKNGTCKENEVLNECPSEDCEYCPTCDNEARKCAASSSSSVNCPPAKCTCRYNYKRLSNGTCVPAKDCPSFKCSHPNEQFDSCPFCPSDECERATPSGDCPRIGRIGIPFLCRPSCRCKKNYWRNGDHCVRYEECPNIKSKPSGVCL